MRRAKLNSIIISMVAIFIFSLGSKFYDDQIKPLFATSTSRPAPRATPRPTQRPTSAPLLPDIVSQNESVRYHTLVFQLQGVYKHDKVATGNGYYYTPPEGDQIVDLIFSVKNPNVKDEIVSITGMGLSTAPNDSGYYSSFFGYKIEDHRALDPFSINLNESGSDTDIRFTGNAITYLRLIFFPPKREPALYFRVVSSDLMQIANP